MATLQVSGIEEDLYEQLRRKAAQNGRSISQEVLAILREFLARPAGRPIGNVTDEFLKLAGTWRDDRTAQEIAEDLRAERRPGRRDFFG